MGIAFTTDAKGSALAASYYRRQLFFHFLSHTNQSECEKLLKSFGHTNVDTVIEDRDILVQDMNVIQGEHCRFKVTQRIKGQIREYSYICELLDLLAFTYKTL